MLKINSKKKVNKPANSLKPQFTQKKPLVQPEWNSTQSDLSQYKLSKAEQVQKKVSMISKHRYEAKELWLQRQEKLKKGIVDEETQTVMETCLLTKRPPERNTKNLSYFVKDDTYADYLNQAYEESEEKRLCMADLHQQQQEKSEFKPKIEKARIETTTNKQKNNQDAEEGDDFIRKVNESLKDARDFMTKMERYPSLSNPEKALKALTSVNKENHSRSSSSHAQSKPKPAAVNTSSSNLKSSLNNSQNGNKRNLSSSSGFKDSSPQLSKKTTTTKVEENLPKSQPKSQPRSEEEYEEEEVSAPKEQNVEKGEDISNYFKSLNQIEDTIKFLEENIMGGGSSVPENKVQEDFDYKAPTSLQRFGFEDLTIKSPIMNNKIQEYSPHKIEEKDDEEEDSYFKKRQPSPKHHDSDHEEDHEKDLSHDDEQISFALTMRSNDQTERNYGHDNHSYDKPDYASKLFGFNDVISPITASLKPFPIPIQQSSPEYPQAIFENKAIQERTKTQPIVKPVVQHSPPKAQPVEEEEDEDEEDFNIERIKGLLQATKLEIDKMNTGQMEAYNNSYKTALEDMDKENISNNKGFSTLPKYNTNYDDTYKSEYPMPMGKKIEVVKNEAFVTVKQPFNALWENHRRVLADVNNNKNMYDDDIPAPQTLEIKKQAVAMNYSPKKVDDVPFNFRSFRK